MRNTTDISCYRQNKNNQALVKQIEEVAYMMGHGKIGPPPDNEEVDTIMAMAELVVHYLTDALEEETQLDEIDLLDALATAGVDLKPVPSGKQNIAAWAYHMTMAERAAAFKKAAGD